MQLKKYITILVYSFEPLKFDLISTYKFSWKNKLTIIKLVSSHYKEPFRQGDTKYPCNNVNRLRNSYSEISFNEIESVV